MTLKTCMQMLKNVIIMKILFLFSNFCNIIITLLSELYSLSFTYSLFGQSYNRINESDTIIILNICALRY